MNNDIKEKIKAYYIREDIDKILDYITNLQEDIRIGKEIIDELAKENEKLRMKNAVLRKDIDSFREDLDKANDIIEKDRQFYKCRMDEYAELKEENEKLQTTANNCKQENERLNQNNQSYQEEMTRTWKIADDYKTRIDKVTEYIKDKNNLILNQDRRKLMNILNGSDENE